MGGRTPALLERDVCVYFLFLNYICIATTAVTPPRPNRHTGFLCGGLVSDNGLVFHAGCCRLTGWFSAALSAGTRARAESQNGCCVYSRLGFVLWGV